MTIVTESASPALVLRPHLTISDYWEHTPEPAQLAFLMIEEEEAFFGGAAGGGKSDALLMAALQFVDTPGYAALILRRTYPELIKADGLIPRSIEWLGGKGPKWNQADHTWTFPGNATLEFGHLQRPNDIYKYHSAAYQFIGFDELTTFTEFQYTYLFSRLRRKAESSVPIRMRSASNPGGVGHDWVKKRFIDEGAENGRYFIPARLKDNPHLDEPAYVRSLSNLDPVTRSRLLRGDWSARYGGSIFRREWFEIVDAVPAQAKRIRWWDMASTPESEGRDPDWTRGLRLALFEGVAYVEDIRSTRNTPGAVEDLIRQTADTDGRAVAVRMGEDPGAAGKAVIAHYQRNVLLGYDFRGIRETGSKLVRAGPVSSAAEAKNVKLLRGNWNRGFLDEAEAFDGSETTHDDQVDALSGAYNELTGRARWGAV